MIVDEDYSLQACLPADPWFWIRLDKPCGPELRVTDLVTGQMSLLETGLALRKLMEKAERPATILVTDVHPAWIAGSPASLMELERRLADARDILSVALGLPAEDLKMELRRKRGRFQLRATVPDQHKLH